MEQLKIYIVGQTFSGLMSRWARCYCGAMRCAWCWHKITEYGGTLRLEWCHQVGVYGGKSKKHYCSPCWVKLEAGIRELTERYGHPEPSDEEMYDRELAELKKRYSHLRK